MTTATPKAKSVSAELARLERANDKARAKVRAAREKRDAYDEETVAMGYRLSERLEAHPEEAEGLERRIKPNTEAARIEAEIKRRKREPNPHEDAYYKARDAFHARDVEVETFKRERVLDRLAELDPEIAAAEERLRNAHAELADAAKQYAGNVTTARGIVVDTKGFNGQDLDHDPRPTDWARLAADVLASEIAPPALTARAQERAGELRGDDE